MDFQTKDEIIQNYTTEQFNNEIQNKIQILNERYDKFVAKNGYINDKANIGVFRNDISFPLLTSIEKEVNGKFEKTDIFYKLTIKIKSEIKIENAEDIIKNGLEIDGEKKDISFLKPIIKRNIEKVFKELNISYPARTAPILVTGGGGATFFNSIKKRYPNSELVDNNLFSNAIGYKKVGEKLWQD